MSHYYRHFKGGLYRLLGTAIHSETLEEMVIYQAMYGEHKVWVRPSSLFFSKATHNGIEVERFKEISEEEFKEKKTHIITI